SRRRRLSRRDRFEREPVVPDTAEVAPARSSHAPMPPPAGQHPEVTPSALRLIRVALLLAPVLIAAVFAYLAMQSGPILEEAEVLEPLRLAFIGVAVIAAVGVFLIQGRRAQADTFQQQASLCIIGWAIAEMAATFGAVYL